MRASSFRSYSHLQVFFCPRAHVFAVWFCKPPGLCCPSALTFDAVLLRVWKLEGCLFLFSHSEFALLYLLTHPRSLYVALLTLLAVLLFLGCKYCYL